MRLLQEFSGIRSCDPGPWQEKLTLTLCSRNGTKVALTPRVNTAEQWHPSVCGAVNDT